jgi:hypothetical protein
MTFATLPLALTTRLDLILFSIVSLGFSFFILFYKFSFYYTNIYLVRCEGPYGVPEVLHKGSAGTARTESLQKGPAPERSKTEKGRYYRVTADREN